MSTLEVTSVSSRGQVVIPNSIRAELHLETGDKSVVISDGGNILLKKIEAPAKKGFRELIEESRQFAESTGMKQSDVTDMIKEVRLEKKKR
jgi:AbrB family looped-hinge helix DNA binding protein